jgi:predicted amidohydrolase YtcJ
VTPPNLWKDGVGITLPGQANNGRPLFVLSTSSHTHFLIVLLQTDLDADPMIRGRPVILEGKDGHAIWVSSKAMELSAPFPDTVDGGITVRDEAGNPTGTYFNPLNRPTGLKWPRKRCFH